MTQRLAPVLLLAFCFGGCIGRERLNPNCEWTNDAALPLDLLNASHQRHLSNDATVAEDLAIRYADARRGHRSGHFMGSDEYARTREQCMTTLFGVIATNHRVDAQQVRDLLGRRPVDWDVAVLLSFAVLYGLVSNRLVGWIFSRLGFVTLAPALATAVLSAMVSAGGVAAFGLWVGISEGARLRTAHMSYRALRLPWRQDRLDLFIVGVFFFLIIAMLRYRTIARQAEVQSA